MSTLFKRITFGTATALALASSAMAADTKLVMFEEDGCIWCERWNAEIGPIYPKTDEGKRAPLERIDVKDAEKAPYKLTAKPFFTPTFVLIEDGAEVDRIEGYPGQDFFWAMLGKMIGELPAPDEGGTDSGGS
ncbi:hypothetical protein [Brevirhabdus sp.]|uniref:hypothetical protein n=1 Tax=Brevirhabdus sp. TaxID=2004514 RepID=UPI0040584886